MAGQSWCINIVPSGDTVAFNADVYGTEPGSPLQAEVGDLVSWANETDSDRTITVSGETFDVRAWSSTDAYQIQNTDGTPTPYTITYTCTAGSATATGQIDVIA